MSKLKFQYISWRELENICFKLAKKVAQKDFDRIVCISRGGAVAARIFSDFLNLPISNFVISSYVKVGKSSHPKVTEKLTVDIKNENILLIDEIVDTGKTLKKALAYLKKKSPKSIYTIVPFIKPHTIIKPDLWEIETTNWIIFPYEVRETIQDVSKIWNEQGISQKRMLQKFIRIGLPREEIEYFLKEPSDNEYKSLMGSLKAPKHLRGKKWKEIMRKTKKEVAKKIAKEGMRINLW